MITLKATAVSILKYLSENNFLIPMYQRKYVWSEDECEKLFDDLYDFYENQENSEKYFLGTVVLYNRNDVLNIIDGQQRTTTLSLLIRAFYDLAINHKKRNEIEGVIDDLSLCLWEKDRISKDINYDKIRLDSKVAFDNDKESLKKIFKEKINIDQTSKNLSLYEKNFLYFQNKIKELSSSKPFDVFHFIQCVLDFCMILPIHCDSFDNALRIFNTLNNRGTPLSTADIFKSLIFQSKINANERKKFAEEWRELEADLYHSNFLTGKDDITFLFSQYQHIIRAKYKEVDTSITSPLEFYTQKDKLNCKKKNVNFAANENLLFQDETFEFIQRLGKFWCNPYDYLDHPQTRKYFTILFINSGKFFRMVISACFYMWDVKQNKAIFDLVLPQLAAYNALAIFHRKNNTSGTFWAYMKANVNMIAHNMTDFIFEKSQAIPYTTMPPFETFKENCKTLIPTQTRYILALYALLYNENQELEWNKGGKNYSIKDAQIEHIFPKKWKDAYFADFTEQDADEYGEQIGNKILLEKKNNIQAGNDYFKTKKESYKNSHFLEIQALAKNRENTWCKTDIEARNKQIYESFEKFFSVMFKSRKA